MNRKPSSPRHTNAASTTADTDTMNSLVDWYVSDELIGYHDALALMEKRVEAIASGRQPELVWLLHHPPIYTAGTSARDTDLKHPLFPVFRTGRGGQYTYHGPGQRIAYVMLDLKRRGPDIRRFVADLEEWLIATLASLAVRGERRQDRVGVWVARPDKGRNHEDKIAAIGIRVRRWVSFHGISLNVAPNLSHFTGISPCGVADPRFGVTSLADLGHAIGMSEVDLALRRAFEARFGATKMADVAREAGMPHGSTAK
jgi:lipoyl(octanoyl) transferase